MRCWYLLVVAGLAALAVGMPAGAGSSAAANGKIVFESTRGGNPDIYVMESDGTSIQRLTEDSAQDSAPHWSPDGSSIYFASDRNERWQLFRMTAEGAGQKPIPIKSPTASAPFAPRVSADGTLIAFESFDQFGHATVHVASVNGGTERNLTPSGLEDRAPNWAPVGDQIILSRGSPATGVYALYIVDTSNGSSQKLTAPPAGASDSEPAWSPSGSQIAFTRIKRSGNYDVYSMPATPLAKVRRLTTDPAEDGGPVWSPDETKILFRSSRSGSYELWTMNADGSQQTELTPDPKGIDVAADWAPQQAGAFTTPGPPFPRALARAANFYCVTPPGAAPTTGGHDVINGTPFDDFLCGGGGPDAIHGGDGNDQIDGGSGNDRRTNGGILAGDAGDDLIFARALSAPTGDCDYIDGGSGLNTAWVDTSTVPCGKTTRHKDVWVNVSVTRPP